MINYVTIPYSSVGADILRDQVFKKVYLKRSGERDDRGRIYQCDTIVFVGESSNTFLLTHDQDCCEDVWVEDIAGDLSDLVGTKIILAEESKDKQWDKLEELESGWTFYRLRTIKGDVTIRFNGKSNGFYSVEAKLYKV